MNFCVVNSTDLNPVYAYFMPIVSRIWGTYMGYAPISLLYGSEEMWRSTKINSFLLNEINSTSQIHYVKPVSGYRSSTVMQLARVLTCAVTTLHNNDYVLTSDVDMIPLSKSYFKQMDRNKKFHIFSADAYTDITKGWEPSKFPMCYLGGVVEFWKEIFDIKTNDISAEVVRSLEGRADTWDNDEVYSSNKIRESKYYKGEMQLMVRSWPGSRAFKRLDREIWSFNGQPDLIDCHSLRPGYNHIDELTQLFNSYFKNDVQFLRNYTEKFKRNL